MPNTMKTKAPNIIGNMNSTNQSPFIRFYFEFVHLKHLYRQGWLARGIPTESCESVAEHSFGVAVTAMILAETFFPVLDTLKVLRMALIHDFGEVYAGDIIPGHQVPPEKKQQLERESLVRVFASLPNSEKYIAIWEEFENGASPEAKFVRQIDKLEMALQASVYQHLQMKNLGEFYQSAGSGISSPELQTILKELEALR
ncbi:HD family hydrolase [Chloroflexota bacterium]